MESKRKPHGNYQERMGIQWKPWPMNTHGKHSEKQWTSIGTEHNCVDVKPEYRKQMNIEFKGNRIGFI